MAEALRSPARLSRVCSGRDESLLPLADRFAGGGGKTTAQTRYESPLPNPPQAEREQRLEPDQNGRPPSLPTLTFEAA
jgi:hypothetical protein